MIYPVLFIIKNNRMKSVLSPDQLDFKKKGGFCVFIGQILELGGVYVKK